VSDRDVVENQIKTLCTPLKVLADEPRDHLSLSDELGRVELGDCPLENFVHDGRQNTLVVICPEFAVDCSEGRCFWSREHSASYVDHLKICSTQGSVRVPPGLNRVEEKTNPWFL
jgi:hypothetical protein